MRGRVPTAASSRCSSFVKNYAKSVPTPPDAWGTLMKTLSDWLVAQGMECGVLMGLSAREPALQTLGLSWLVQVRVLLWLPVVVLAPWPELRVKRAFLLVPGRVSRAKKHRAIAPQYLVEEPGSPLRLLVTITSALAFTAAAAT